MATRKLPPGGYVNLHGQPIDPRQLGRAAPDQPLAGGPPLDEADLATVFDALCLAGAARGKSWVLQFLNGMGWRPAGLGRHFRLDEVQQALQQLQADGRARRDEGFGYSADPVARQARWPVLWRHAEAPRFWRQWCTATSGVPSPGDMEPAWVPLRTPDDAEALARLVLMARPSGAEFNRLAQGVMGRAATLGAIVPALAEPFDAEFLAALPADMLWGLLASVDSQAPELLAGQPALSQWMAAEMQRAPKRVPGIVWVRTAERRLLAGDATAVREALQWVPADVLQRQMLEALLLVHAGRWAQGVAAVTEVQKELAKAVGKRRGLAPPELLQWQVFAQLALPDPAAWTAARKFAIAESGGRTPSAFEPWGRFAHAAAVRLGDAVLQATAFDAPTDRWGRNEAAVEDAQRVILAAWLGHQPMGWTEPLLAEVATRLRQRGRHWLADLHAQACAKLGLPLPPRPTDAPPAWAAAWFGAPAEPWREALAAITALGAEGAAAAAEGAPQPLHWRLTLDAAGRPFDLNAFERSQGARGAMRLKPLTVAALKKATRLDARDAAVARCLRQSDWNKRVIWLDLAAAVVALVGHPDLALADAPEQPLQLVEGLPAVEVRRERQPDGSEAWALRIDDALAADAPPELAHHWPDVRDAEEAARRNAVRIVRDAPDRARLIRVTAAQRRVAELAAKPWAVPLQAEAELGGALRVLAGHFTVHSDAAGGRSVPAEPRLVAQLTPRGGSLSLRLAVRPFAHAVPAAAAEAAEAAAPGGKPARADAAAKPGPVGPLLPPGQGRPRLMITHAGEALVTQRDLPAERAHLAALGEALPFLGEPDAQLGWQIDEPELALATLETLGRHMAVAALEWPQGKPLRVVAPQAEQLAVTVRAGQDWLALDGSLRVDDDTVLSLQQLLGMLAQSRGSRFVALGEGAWLALTERLRQQLADLQALAETEGLAAKGKGKPGADALRVPAAAAAWLADTLGSDGQAPDGDAAWRQRVQRLSQAQALNPEPPATLQATLRPYQAEGFAWLVRRTQAGFGAVLADDMGLGKTLQTLALLLHRAAEGPALVVAPTSVVANWAAETQRFAPSLRVRDYAGEGREAVLADAGTGDVVLVSYGLLLREAEAFARLDWGTLVLDEAQALKNAATQRAKAVADLRAGCRVALSGTPVENRLSDLWSLMNLLNPGLLGNAPRFAERFGNPIERQRDDGARARLRRLVSPFILRRTKAQVLDDLPPRTEIVLRIEPEADERALIEAMRREAVDRVASSAQAGQHAAFQVLAELTRLRRAACDPRLAVPGLAVGGAKLRAFEQLAQELVAGRHKALVFSQFTDYLDLLGECLSEAGIRYQRLDGSTPAAMRAQRVAAFQRGEGELFLISLKAGGFGLNLTAADYVIIADPWWNPAAEDQATGRAHRMGQQRPVTVYRLVLAGSVEERIVALHHDKRALADGLLEGQDGAAAPLAADELLDLLRG